MSTNFKIVAYREVEVVKTKHRFTEQRIIGTFQTPTDITMQILKADSPLQAYFDYIAKEFDFEESIENYAPDDIFGENPISITKRNCGQHSIEQTQNDINLAKTEGFEIYFTGS